tara:strand:- start:1130 stop:1531 length:402 start_codon:yes stop_codon:yes gene_type:complete
MDFNIDSVLRYNTSSSLSDVVFLVKYNFIDSSSSSVDGVVNYERKGYSLQLDSVESSNFTDYASLTTGSFKEWVQSSHGNNWGSFTSSIDTQLSSSVASKRGQKPIEIMSWASNSISLDSVALESGYVEEDFD